MKEQNKIPEKDLNETDLTNLSDAELKTLVIKMRKGLMEYRNKIIKEPGRNEGYTKYNKEKSIGNQQWRG